VTPSEGTHSKDDFPATRLLDCGFSLTTSCQFILPHAELKTACEAWSYMAIGHM
jgi:hypothetical protein